MLWEWISPFISWITKPLSWIKSLLSLPWIIALKTFAVVVGKFFLTNPIGIALLAIGVIALNWKDIKASITGYIDTIKGWIKKALTWLGQGWRINDPDDEIPADMGMDDTADEDDVGRVK